VNIIGAKRLSALSYSAWRFDLHRCRISVLPTTFGCRAIRSAEGSRVTSWSALGKCICLCRSRLAAPPFDSAQGRPAAARNRKLTVRFGTTARVAAALRRLPLTEVVPFHLSSWITTQRLPSPVLTRNSAIGGQRSAKAKRMGAGYPGTSWLCVASRATGETW
jgi:hypothetical protein